MREIKITNHFWFDNSNMRYIGVRLNSGPFGAVETGNVFEFISWKVVVL
jgi:hypothetical protein